MLIEAAARELYEYLRPTGNVSTVGVGRCQDEPALIVYLKDDQDQKLQRRKVFKNFRVVYRRKRGSG